MHPLLAVFSFAFIAACSHQPPKGAGEAGCPAGMFVGDGWQGEYPGPILDIRASVQVRAFREVCDPQPTLACTVPPGLYHPWSKTTESRFATLRAITTYKALSDFELDAVDDQPAPSFPAGTLVEILYYYGEGICQWRIAGKTYDNACPEQMVGEGEAPLFEEQKPATPPPEDRQFFLVKCPDGSDAWVEVDEALMSAPGVKEGQVLEYGEVGPAADE